MLEQRAHNMLTEENNNGIIKLGINMFDTSDPLYVESFSIEEEEGFKDVFLHGSSSSVQIKKEGKLVNLSPTSYFDDLYKNELKDLKENVRSGKISVGYRNRKREVIIVDNLLNDYTGGLIEYET